MVSIVGPAIACWPLTGNLSATLAAGLAALGLCALAIAARQARGTTLLPMAYWSMFAVVAIAGVEIAIGLEFMNDPTAQVAFRWAAAMGSFAGPMALLGARRPLTSGWQWIVASLLVVLGLPSGEWLLFGGPTEIHPARIGFLSLLILATALNGVATPRWPASVLYAAAQAALMSRAWSSSPWLGDSGGPLIGLALLDAAWLSGAMQQARTNRCRPAGWNRVWLDFRDAFGAVWSLRTLERLNHDGALAGWPTRLAWQGFVGEQAQPCDALSAGAADGLRTHLRRFVDASWIDVRLG